MGKDNVLMLPGIFNKGEDCFIDLSIALMEKFVPLWVNLPERTTYFSQSPRDYIASHSIGSDAAYVLKLFKFYEKQLKPGEKIHVLGHSRGALLAMLLDMKLAENANLGKIVLAAPAPFMGIKARTPWINVIKTFASSFCWKFWEKPVDRSFLGTCYGVLGDNLGYDEAKEIQDSLVWESGQVLLELALKKTEIKIPLLGSRYLVIGGKKDRLIPPPLAREIAGKIGAKYLEFDLPHYMLNLVQADSKSSNKVELLFKEIIDFLEH